MIKNKVSIIGLGYVGLPLALAIAKNKKYKVFGLDIDEQKTKKIKGFKATTDNSIIKNSEYVIICVPTPVKKNKLPDLTPVKTATKTVLKYLEKEQKIIIESTINPGVCEEVVLPILEKSGLKGGADFELSHCPERINPGDPKWNVSNIPRNIGSLTKTGNKEVANFYRSFLKAEINELNSIKAAEATKIIENTFRDINIAYVNELAKSFDQMGIDLLEVIKGASNKPFAFMPHFPSCGVGGHCIPVDPYYLIDRAKQAGFDHGFLRKAREVNNSMPKYTVDLLIKKLKENGKTLKNTKVGLLGLAYKADIADLRESPSLKIIEILKEKGTFPLIFDPYFPDKNSTKTLSELLKKVDTIIIATAHKEFKKLTGKTLKDQGVKIVIDGKNCLNKQEIQKANIIYKGIGT